MRYLQVRNKSLNPGACVGNVRAQVSAGAHGSQQSLKIILIFILLLLLLLLTRILLIVNNKKIPGPGGDTPGSSPWFPHARRKTLLAV